VQSPALHLWARSALPAAHPPGTLSKLRAHRTRREGAQGHGCRGLEPPTCPAAPAPSAPGPPGPVSSGTAQPAPSEEEELQGLLGASPLSLGSGCSLPPPALSPGAGQGLPAGPWGLASAGSISTFLETPQFPPLKNASLPCFGFLSYTTGSSALHLLAPRGKSKNR